MEPTEQQIKDLLELSISQGVIKKAAENQFTSIRLAYYPFCSSLKVYELVQTMSQLWQKLIYKASRDEELVERVFKHICCEDPVIAKLLELIKKGINKECPKFNFVRNDFFIDINGLPKLIEYNIDSVSMSAHSQNYQRSKKLSDFGNSHTYFDNTPNQKFLNAIKKVYLEKKLSGIFLFVIQKGEKNIIQQRIIQKGLFERGIKAKMITLDQIIKLTANESHTLLLGEEVVDFVYFRSGYKSQEYVQDWQNLQKALEIIHFSNAIKIPDSTFKLFNSKRMQTQLSKEKVYTKYLTKEEADILKLSIIRQWEFDDMPENQFKELLKEYEGNKQNFILKPNCEGGGNNLWGEEGYETLKNSQPKQRSNYILMERIQTKPIENILIDGQKHVKTMCDYEISNFGLLQGEGEKMTQNEIVGHLIRIKPVTEHEGGILAGVGSLCAWRKVEEN